MAKSKSGGTRSYIRGRVGADVYSVGKDGNGKKQQVVRSLAETVSNPRTLTQMKGRMIMSTVMQAVSAMSQLVDHSFDNVSNGQPSISEFIRRNYSLIKADVEAHPSSGNTFGLSKYGEKGMKGGAYVLSAGDVIVPNGISTNGGILQIELGQGSTLQQLADALGIGAGDFITLCAWSATNGFTFIRVGIPDSATMTTVITQANILELLTVENYTKETSPVYYNGENFGINVDQSVAAGSAAAYIISRKVNGSWKHSDSVLLCGEPDFTADVALPTYPTGEAKFLNGGDI